MAKNIDSPPEKPLSVRTRDDIINHFFQLLKRSASDRRPDFEYRQTLQRNFILDNVKFRAICTAAALHFADKIDEVRFSCLLGFANGKERRFTSIDHALAGFNENSPPILLKMSWRVFRISKGESIEEYALDFRFETKLVEQTFFRSNYYPEVSYSASGSDEEWVKIVMDDIKPYIDFTLNPKPIAYLDVFEKTWVRLFLVLSISLAILGYFGVYLFKRARDDFISERLERLEMVADAVSLEQKLENLARIVLFPLSGTPTPPVEFGLACMGLFIAAMVSEKALSLLPTGSHIKLGPSGERAFEEASLWRKCSFAGSPRRSSSC